MRDFKKTIEAVYPLIRCFRISDVVRKWIQRLLFGIAWYDVALCHHIIASPRVFLCLNFPNPHQANFSAVVGVSEDI